MICVLILIELLLVIICGYFCARCRSTIFVAVLRPPCPAFLVTRFLSPFPTTTSHKHPHLPLRQSPLGQAHVISRVISPCGCIETKTPCLNSTKPAASRAHSLTPTTVPLLALIYLLPFLFIYSIFRCIAFLASLCFPDPPLDFLLHFLHCLSTSFYRPAFLTFQPFFNFSSVSRNYLFWSDQLCISITTSRRSDRVSRSFLLPLPCISVQSYPVSS